MFLDIRATLATFVTAVGLALVVFAVGIRAYVGSAPAGPQVEAHVPAMADPFERGFGPAGGVTPAAAAPIAPSSSASLQGFLSGPRPEPAAAATRDATPAPANVVPTNVMPGAVVQERFDVLHEPAAQLVPRGAAVIPLPRPRTGEASAPPVAGTGHAVDSTRPKGTVAATQKRPDQKRPRQTSSIFDGLFGN